MILLLDLFKKDKYRVRQHNFFFYNEWQSGCRSSSGVGVFFSRDEILKIPWKYCLLFESTVCDCNPAGFSKPFQCCPERPCSGPEINCCMGHYFQANQEYDTTKNWSTSAHQIIWEHWGSESFNLAIPTMFYAQTCLCSWTCRSFSEANTSQWPSLPSLQDDDCVK